MNTGKIKNSAGRHRLRYGHARNDGMVIFRLALGFPPINKPKYISRWSCGRSLGDQRSVLLKNCGIWRESNGVLFLSDSIYL